jgi:hypothetical protein
MYVTSLAVSLTLLTVYSYTGKGAFGTSVGGNSNKSNAAVIGGSVGGVVGAVVLVGAAILFWLYRKKRPNTTTTPTTPATANQPMMFQQQPSSPNSPGTQPSYFQGMQDQTSPVMSQHSIAYTGMQPGGSSQPGWSRPVSEVGAAPAAPLPMWVERAHTSVQDDGTAGSDRNSLPPGAQSSGLYGAYHPANAQAWSRSR